MTKRTLLQDTNLSEVAFCNNGQGLAFVFLNMRDGREEARLECSGLISVKYHITPSSSLPVYLGEVIHEEVGGDDLARLLETSRYGFTNQDNTVLSMPFSQLQFIHLEGGETDIDIICSEIAFTRQ
jgi:hypothetical protein